MTPPLMALLAPLALDGESVNNSNTAVAAVSLASILAGFLVLAALWYFVFREKARKREQTPEREQARDRHQHRPGD